MVPGDTPSVRRPALFVTSRLLFRLIQWQPAIAPFLAPGLLIEKYKIFSGDTFPRSLERDAYMMGFWQDERYFLDAGDIIRKEFMLRNPLTSPNAALKDRLQTGETVAVHVRRLHNMAASAKGLPPVDSEARGFILDAGYYRKAIAEMSERISQPEFFVFSDFPQWARENISSRAPMHFLEAGRGPDYQDMLLMSRCRHHIVANSSFSWWGAWLAGHDDQVVIAPRNAKYLPNMPENWIKI
jgi:hypothetical protein